jgi:hypothetical protein
MAKEKKLNFIYEKNIKKRKKKSLKVKRSAFLLTFKLTNPLNSVAKLQIAPTKKNLFLKL